MPGIRLLAGLVVGICQLMQTRADAIGYELGSPDHAPNFSSSSEPGSCECRTCCSKTKLGDLSCPTCKNCPAFCSGPSSGCDANSPEWRSGCYGIDRKGNGGDCVCSTGEFKNPEVYKLAGKAFGLIELGLEMIKLVKLYQKRKLYKLL